MRIIFFLFFGLPAFAQTKMTPADLKQLQKQMPQLQSAEIGFEQTRLTKSRPNRPFKSRGSAKFTRDGKFLWAVTSPRPETWIFNGRDLYHVTGAAALQFSGASDRSRDLRRIAEVVLNFDKLMQDYDILPAIEGKDGLVKFSMRPKVPAGDLDTIDIGVEQKKKYVKTVGLNFKNASKSIFDFQEPRSIPLSAANFTVPPGVSVTKAL